MNSLSIAFVCVVLFFVTSGQGRAIDDQFKGKSDDEIFSALAAELRAAADTATGKPVYMKRIEEMEDVTDEEIASDTS